MKLVGPTEDEAIAALEQLKKTVRIAFCGVMQSTQLPPMAALTLAAMAVGSLYHEVAAAHRGDNQPVPAAGSRVAAWMWRRCKPRSRSRPSNSRAPICAQWRSPALPERREARRRPPVFLVHWRARP